MAHIFKPGDRAYWVKHRQWVTLKEFTHRDYPLKTEEGEGGFTLDGRFICGGDIVLLPINPYDASDPNNPPEFRYPFIYEKRAVKIGDQISKKSGVIVGKVSVLQISEENTTMHVYGDNGWTNINIGSPEYTFADSLPKKKITYLWAFPIAGVPGAITIDFKRMTQEEGERYPGAKIVPGSEKEES